MPHNVNNTSLMNPTQVHLQRILETHVQQQQVAQSKVSDESHELAERQVTASSPPPQQQQQVQGETAKSPTVNVNVGGSSSEDNWFSLDFDELEVIKKIGEGSFGIVYYGKWRDQDVAIKRLKEFDEARKLAFVREASLMITIKTHKNLIRLYGICHNRNKPLAIVTEYLELGSLKELLLKSTKLLPLQIVTIAKDIARGMQHLHREKVIHRDLSARNILVTTDKGGYVCKVSDFGLSRVAESGEGFTQATTGPLRWMAPESLLEKKYSEKSDIWSYACTLVEVLTEGKDPYPDQPEALHVAAMVMLENARPSIPENTPLKLTNLLKQCFQRDPSQRPDFKQILDVLLDVENDIKMNPFY